MDMSVSDSNPRPDSGSMEVDPVHSGAVSNKRPRVSVKESQQCLPRVTITSLSIELFIEVTKYLRPGDLLSLVRCIKLFRGCLMDKNSQFIWRQSMQNVRGLPACPPGFTEPRYLAILFSNFCTVCGKNKKCQVDAILLVRLCASCQKQCLVRLFDTRQVPDDIRELLHKSNAYGKVTNRGPPEARVLKSEVASIVKKLGEVELLGGDHAMAELKEQRREAVSERRKQAQQITRALELYENDVNWEQRKIQTKRRQEIERRCIDMLNRSKDDLQFAWSSPKRKEYYQLLNKPVVLCEREWVKIRPKLERILDDNLTARLQLSEEQKDWHRSQCPKQSLIFNIDPVIDGIGPTEGIGLLDGIYG